MIIPQWRTDPKPVEDYSWYDWFRVGEGVILCLGLLAWFALIVSEAVKGHWVVTAWLTAITVASFSICWFVEWSVKRLWRRLCS